MPGLSRRPMRNSPACLTNVSNGPPAAASATTSAPLTSACSSNPEKSVISFGNAADPSTRPPCCSTTADTSACKPRPNTVSAVMKNQRRPPSATIARADPVASAAVS